MPSLSLIGKEKAFFGSELKSIFHRTALLKDRERTLPCLGNLLLAEGGSQLLPDIGVIPQSGMPR